MGENSEVHMVIINMWKQGEKLAPSNQVKLAQKIILVIEPVNIINQSGVCSVNPTEHHNQ
jgi:hypothetical protein